MVPGLPVGPVVGFADDTPVADIVISITAVATGIVVGYLFLIAAVAAGTVVGIVISTAAVTAGTYIGIGINSIIFVSVGIVIGSVATVGTVADAAPAAGAVGVILLYLPEIVL